MVICHTCKKVLGGSVSIAGMETDNRAWYLGRDSASVFCRGCWEKEILALPFVQLQTNTLDNQRAFFQQRHSTLKTQHIGIQLKLGQLNSQHITLQEEHARLQQQHNDLRVHYDALKEYQLAFQYTNEIVKLQVFMKRFTPTQVQQLLDISNFSVEVYEEHASAHLNTTQQFVDVAYTHLMASIHKVLLHQTAALNKRESGRKEVLQSMKDAEVPESILQMAVGPLEKEMEELNGSLKNWNALLAALEQELGSTPDKKPNDVKIDSSTQTNQPDQQTSNTTNDQVEVI